MMDFLQVNLPNPSKTPPGKRWRLRNHSGLKETIETRQQKAIHTIGLNGGGQYFKDLK